MLTDVMDRHTKQVLKDVGGNVSEAARRLGIDRRTLQRWQNDGETFSRKVQKGRARRTLTG